MKFEVFKVNEYRLHSVSRVQVVKAPRKRVVHTNINGDMLIDQGVIKRTVTANIVLCSEADIQTIEAAVAAAIVPISFYEGKDLITIEASISRSERPKPFLLNGSRENGTYYNGITLVFEER